MKSLPLIASSLYLQPWCLLGEVHAELGSLYKSYISGTLAPDSLHGSQQVTSGVGYEVHSDTGLALITVEGVIAKRAPDTMCGPKIADIAILDRLLIDCANDPHIETVVIYLDTPGGCGLGLLETSENLADLRASGKRVVAYTEMLCASAGYWIAAGCEKVFAAPSAQVGSINAYIAAIDSSRAWEMEGLELKLFRGGDLKALGHPGKQWTEEEEAHLTERALHCADQFKAHVSSHRPELDDSAMRGQCFSANEAPTGLVDGLYRSLSDLLVAEMELLK